MDDNLDSLEKFHFLPLFVPFCRSVARPGPLPGDWGPPSAVPVQGPRREGHQIGKRR